MKAWVWFLLAAAGFGLMFFSFDRWLRIDPDAPWASGFLIVGNKEPGKAPGSGTTLATRLRLLPAGEMVEAMLRGVTQATPERTASLRVRIAPKLVELPAAEMGFLAGRLREGRMPEPGKDELLGGCQVRLNETLNVGGRALTVVGVLEPSVALLAACYLVAPSEQSSALFPADEPSVLRVRIARLSAAEFGDHNVRKQFAEAYPSKEFTLLPPEVRSGEAAYGVYLAGQVLFLLGGSGLLIGLYGWLAARAGSSVLEAPLREIAGRPRLLWSTHLIFFGLYVVGSLIIFRLPVLQAVLLSGIQQEIGSGEGPLGVVGKAYASGNILRAAVATFVVNFFLGSLAVITLPSMIIPGGGAVVAAFRACLWGLLLGPSEVTLARAMLPHTGTLLLEGGGYILAAFFAMLIPIHLVGPGRLARKRPVVEDLAAEQPGSVADVVPSTAEGPDTVWRRFGRVLVLNIKGNLLVAAVLAVAACYEAVEVIWMAGL